MIPSKHVLCGEAADTNIIVVGLNWPGFEHMISCIQSEHANQYTTDEV